MIKTAPNAGSPRRARAKRHPVGLTALLYLRDALREERYENCADFVATAKEFGATENEVRYLLEDPRRQPG